MNELLNKFEYKTVRGMLDEGDLLYLTISGSIAYGTNNENSDIDLRGIMATPERTLLGLERYEQFEDKKTDTVIYTANKYLKLLHDCNPNCVELMGTKKEHQLYISAVGKMILDNYKMFLSQRVFYTFEGYAMAQLNRLKNALIRNADTEAAKCERMAERISNMLYDFNSRYCEIPQGMIKIHPEKVNEEDQLFVDVKVNHYPLNDMVGIFSEMGNCIKDFNKVKPGIEGLNRRNRKKSPEKLDKHAMHLVRLYIMSIELGKTGDVVTYRENDRDFLLKIRNGYFRNSDGTYNEVFFDMVEDYKNELEGVKKDTVLPVKADYDQVQDFIMTVNKMTLGV